MACSSCSRRRTETTNRTSSTATYSYEVTLPAGDKTTYLQPLEAKRAVRRAGGGSIRRVTNKEASA